MKNRVSASTHKKVVVLLLDHTVFRGYLNHATLGKAEVMDFLTQEGESQEIILKDVKSVYFVREFTEPFEPERKIFLSRPKLDGLWVYLRFQDGDAMEGIISNNLLDLLDSGVQLTPPDLHGNTLRMFIPRSALAEIKVLGVVGVARRTPRQASGRPADALPVQPKLFGE